MTIHQLNTHLNELGRDSGREKVIEFAYSLTKWIGLQPNAGNKPQLVAPQTQKLKEYLAPAPQTVQPQLYRLTADDQNIRIRFAVLKKLKKEYIRQLVDNDPGLGSYQAFTKNLTTSTNGTAFIPAQPYFIHFITTPDYDRLVLIFNQGEQKRIVTFRDRLTNTQYNKIVLKWQGIGTKSKPEIADLFWKSLDIKEVNKEFYKLIKERFDALPGIVKTQHADANENQVKQFTVRLIGRYIFCWFLKEKGIISHQLISKKTIEETKSFYQKTLLKLFFETLNTKVQDRNPLTHEKLFEKIPYLNGGLFEHSEEDKLFSKLQLDAWLLPFVEILESYDFTVDESSSEYQQVAVDPEMLGRIFENLLASQNEETEKLANQRKAFGAFYTPREIVAYMVVESIKAYLQTQWEQRIIACKTKMANNPETAGDIFGNKKAPQLKLEIKQYSLKDEEKNRISKALEPLFETIPEAGHLKKEEKQQLLTNLEQIKILDPACGSGAFPMGILNKLVELHEVLGTVKSSHELKKDILSQNIYGVDIMPMAIEIARLRAWLSLVLEEDYKPNDPKHNFGIKPLPNLDFKFVCANSLIDLGLEGILKNNAVGKNNQVALGLYNSYYVMFQELEDLRKKFFLPDLDHSEKEHLKVQYLKKRDSVVEAIENENDNGLIQIADKIKSWDPFDDSHPSPFFSPTWMFGIEEGFDVVIGNPPYISHDKLADLQEYYKANYKSFEPFADIYCYFIEKGIRLQNETGNLCYITSNSYLRSNYGGPLRKFILETNDVLQLINIEVSQIFEAAIVNTSILFSTKRNSNGRSCKVLNTEYDFEQPFNDFVISNHFLYQPGDLTENSWTLITHLHLKLKKRIEDNHKTLEELGTKIRLGIATGANDVFVIDDDKKRELIQSDKKNEEIIKPILRGRDITRYSYSLPNLSVLLTKNGINVKNDFPMIFDYLDSCGNDFKNRGAQGQNWWNLRACAFFDDFKKEKIVWIELSSKGRFALCQDEVYLLNSAYFLLPPVGLSPHFLLGILNSGLIQYYLKLIAETSGMGTTRWINNFVKEFPVPVVNIDTQEVLINLVKERIGTSSDSPKAIELENEIDLLVYKLYGLTYDEVKVIDPNFWLSEAEYAKAEPEKA